MLRPIHKIAWLLATQEAGAGLRKHSEVVAEPKEEAVQCTWPFVSTLLKL